MAPLVAPLADLCRGRDGREPLFTAPRGGSWSVSNWRSRVWRPALKAAGLDRIDGLVVHSLRHTYASIAVAGGADVKTLQKAMGHSSASITLDVYADLWPDSLDNVADAIGRAVRGESLGNSWAVDARNTEGY
ncbi:MAG: tyrosine-type recombinase/integrase [Bifidobacterium dentium]|nr:tyrosine-type recombinase/integrase [Bifidobacterium dentium]